MKMKRCTAIIIKIILFLIVISAIAVLSYQKETILGDTVILKVGSKINEQAEGTEIWVRGISVDGVLYEADSLQEGSWILENGRAGWREYEQPQGLDRSTQITIPYGQIEV